MAGDGSGGGEPMRLVRMQPGLAAFGRSVATLMTKPAFAKAPFGHIARMLAGQVNRGHFAFIERGKATVGFVGWAFTSEELAEAWVTGQRGVSDAEARGGDCVLLNAWAADDPAVSAFIVTALQDLLAGKRRLYAKRHYVDGRTRPLRLPIGRRTGAHAAAMAAAMTDAQG
jgi:hemolysin-activating ACP:hemolysin acyltransferase